MLASTLLLPLLALTGYVSAQDASASGDAAAGGDAAASPSVSADTSTTTGNPGWNTTYFQVPSRLNTWVNDQENTATWPAVNVVTNLILTNSNITLNEQQITLATNISAGTGTTQVNIKDMTVGTNYLLILSDAGTGRKLAQSEGFWIRVAGSPSSNAVATRVDATQVAGTAMGSGSATGADATGATSAAGTGAATTSAAGSGAERVVVSAAALIGGVAAALYVL